MFQKKYLYLMCFFMIFSVLAISYKHSNSILKQFEQNVVTQANKIGVYQGDRAENFQLLDLKGEKVKLSDFQGKKVLVNFFATWCGPCQEEMPTLVELDRRILEEKLVILGVNVTKQEPNPNQIREFIKHYQVKYNVLFDGDGEVMKTYQLIGIPTTILIDENGNIVERLNGSLTFEYIETHSFFKGTIKKSS